MILSTCHFIFLSNNITTYLKIKHVSDIKIFGNPFYKGGFCKYIKYIFKLKTSRYKFVKFTKSITIKSEYMNESEKVKDIFNFFTNSFII
jgi:hypothetical protein